MADRAAWVSGLVAKRYQKLVDAAERERDEWRERAENAEAELAARDAVMAGLRDQLARQAETLRSYQSIIARVRDVCHKAMAERDAPGMWLVAQQVLAAIDDTGGSDGPS